MRRLSLASVCLLTACGQGTAPARALTASYALTNLSDILEFEPAVTRQELFKETARASLAQAGQAATGAVLFPIFRDGHVLAAPGFDARTDLLQAPDAGWSLRLTLDTGADGWLDERSEALQGLSEREAAELVARTLLSRWGIHPEEAVEVDRAPGAPYAAAYVDGRLRLNPALLYMAAAQVAPSFGAQLP